MMTDPPIVCTLTPNKMVDRLSAFEALFSANLTRMEREPLVLRLTFDAVADVGRVRELFEAEQRCCAFLTFTHERTEMGLVVSIAAPPDAGPTLDGFETLAARSGSPETVTRGWTG